MHISTHTGSCACILHRRRLNFLRNKHTGTWALGPWPLWSLWMWQFKFPFLLRSGRLVLVTNGQVTTDHLFFTHKCLAFYNFCENFGQCPSPSWYTPHLHCLRNAREFPLLPAAFASVSFGFVLVRVRVRVRVGPTDPDYRGGVIVVLMAHRFSLPKTWWRRSKSSVKM